MRIYSWLFCIALISNLVLSNETRPRLSLQFANKQLKTHPSTSLDQFLAAEKIFGELSDNHIIKWLKVGVSAHSHLINDLESSSLAWQLYEDHWPSLSANDKRFVTLYLGEAAQFYGQWDMSKAIFQCGLKHSKTQIESINMINNLAGIEMHLSNFEEARRSYESALALLSKQGNYKMRISLYNNIGLTLLRLGKLHEAEDRFKQSYSITSRTGSLRTKLTTLHNLMQTFLERNDWQSWKKYLKLFIRMKDKANIDQVNIVYDWMNTYFESQSLGNPPSEEKIKLLVENAQRVTHPVGYNHLKQVALLMGIPLPERNTLGGKFAQKSAPDFAAFIRQCGT